MTMGEECWDFISFVVVQVFFHWTSPLKFLTTDWTTEKLFKARLGVSRKIYVNVDSPNIGFPYLNFLGGYQ